MKRRPTILLISIVFLFFIAGLYFLIFNKPLENSEMNFNEFNKYQPEEITLEVLKAEMEKYDSDSQIDIETETYKSSKYGFSIKIPENATVSSFQEGREGEVVLFQVNEKDNKNNTPWVQFFVLPFDEEGLVTPERIRQDLPGMEIEDPKYVVIGKDEFKALIFMSDESGIGRTREVWFVKNGYLFQINTGQEYERLLGEMLETIEFR